MSKISPTGKRKSIGQQLAGCKTLDGMIAVSKRWGTDWYNEQAVLLRKLRKAIEEEDSHAQNFFLDQLDAVNEKRHGALPHVLDRIYQRAKKGDEPPVDAGRKKCV